MCLTEVSNDHPESPRKRGLSSFLQQVLRSEWGHEVQARTGAELPSDQPHAEPGEYEAILEALEFPASKSGILQKATDRGGLDAEVVSTLQLLTDRAYSNAADLRSAVRTVYLERGVPEGQLPL